MPSKVYELRSQFEGTFNFFKQLYLSINGLYFLEICCVWVIVELADSWTKLLANFLLYSKNCFLHTIAMTRLHCGFPGCRISIPFLVPFGRNSGCPLFFVVEILFCFFIRVFRLPFFVFWLKGILCLFTNSIHKERCSEPWSFLAMSTRGSILVAISTSMTKITFLVLEKRNK